jgi:hypothetical protein
MVHTQLKQQQNQKKKYVPRSIATTVDNITKTPTPNTFILKSAGKV